MFYTSKCHIEHAPSPLLYEAVFELKESGFKLDVTRWVPRLTQSVYSKYTTLHIQCIYGFCLISGASNCKQKEIDTQGMMCKPIEVWYTS